MQRCNTQNRWSGKMVNRLFDTNKNTGMSHGKNMFKKASDLGWQECVHIHDQNKYYHIRNVFYVVVRNVHG